MKSSMFFALLAALVACSLAAFDPTCGSAPVGGIVPSGAKQEGSAVPALGKVTYDCDNKGNVITNSWTATFGGKCWVFADTLAN